ncbi:MAG: GNAT family N-acetyltransferase [Jatrophihabitans sp.]
MQIDAVPAAEVRPLRGVVLRPNRPVEDLIYPSDDVRGAWHAVARQDGAVVGIISISPEPHPSDPAEGDWRIRGMATDPAVRGAGYGAALLTEALEHARSQGGRRVWCNARSSALGFYARAGFVAEGDEFVIWPDLPHYVMAVKL